MPDSDNKPKPGVKTPFDNEKSALPGLHADPNQHVAHKGGDDAASDEQNEIARMQQGLADIGDKLGRGFTGSMATGLTAAKIGAGSNGAGLIKGIMAGSKKHKKGLIFGGSIATFIIAMATFLLSQFPFGFKAIMINMAKKELAVANTNSDDLQETFMSHYVKKFLLPGMKAKGCTSTLVNKSCAVTVDGDTMLDRMFRSWQKGNIEKRWAQAGFEIQYDKQANKYYMKATGVAGRVDITKYAGGDGNIFREVNRRDIRSAIREAHKNASFHDRIMMRYGLGKMLHDNYNVRRCVLTCKVLDAREKYFTEPIELKKQAFKIMLARRVLMPRSLVMGAAFECFFAGSECDPNKPNIDPETGEFRTQFEADSHDTVQQLLMQDDADVSLAKAQELTKELREKGLQQVVIEKVVDKILGKTGASDATKEATAKIAGRALPVIGTVLAVAGAIDTISSIGTVAKSLNTQVQSQAAVSLYGMNSTYADEVGSANVDAAMVGSFADSFSSGQEKQENGQMGGAGAGAVPLYNAVINNGDQTQTAFNGLFGSKVYAAGEDANNTETYKCPISNELLDPSGRDGKLICKSQTLKYGGYIIDTFGSVANFLNAPGINLITQASKWITGVVGSITGAISEPILEVLRKAPGYSAVVDSITQGIAPILQNLSKYVFPDWINDNMSGGTNFVATDLGARKAAADYSEKVQRGYPLTAQQVNAVETEQSSLDEIAFKNKSFYDRMFDQDDPNSFVTRAALVMPTNLRGDSGQMFSQLISDPFTKVIRSFGAVFSGQRAFAAPRILEDPFGITHYGRSTDDAIFSENPQTYYASRCDDNSHSDDWNKNVITDPDLGIPRHTKSDNCAFLNEGARLGGGMFDSALVEK